MDEAVQEAKLLRQVNALIVAHLRGQNLGQAASAVASATMTPLSAADSVPADHLLRLVARVTLCPPPPSSCLGISSSPASTFAIGSPGPRGGAGRSSFRVRLRCWLRRRCAPVELHCCGFQVSLPCACAPQCRASGH
jgi:hypothetical protein